MCPFDMRYTCKGNTKTARFEHNMITPQLSHLFSKFVTGQEAFVPGAACQT